MKITRIPIYKRLLGKALPRAYKWNTGRTNMETNGEKALMEWLVGKAAGTFTCFDVGANVGGYSETLLAACKKASVTADIHAFEPVKKSFEALAQKLSSERGFKAVNAALSEKAGTLQIHYGAGGSTLASFYKREVHGSSSGSESIQTMTGESYARENGIRHIDLLKVDVEGHELSVFKGFGDFLDPKNIGFIQFEYGGCNLDSQTTLRELYTLLEEKGFRVGRLLKDQIEIRPYAVQMEDFDYSNYVAVNPSRI